MGKQLDDINNNNNNKNKTKTVQNKIRQDYTTGLCP